MGGNNGKTTKTSTNFEERFWMHVPGSRWFQNFSKLGYHVDSKATSVPAFGMPILTNALKTARKSAEKCFFSTFRFSICDCATKTNQMATKLGRHLEQYVLSMLCQVLGTFRLYVHCARLETKLPTFRVLL